MNLVLFSASFACNLTWTSEHCNLNLQTHPCIGRERERELELHYNAHRFIDPDTSGINFFSSARLNLLLHVLFCIKSVSTNSYSSVIASWSRIKKYQLTSGFTVILSLIAEWSFFQRHYIPIYLSIHPWTVKILMRFQLFLSKWTRKGAQLFHYWIRCPSGGSYRWI